MMMDNLKTIAQIAYGATRIPLRLDSALAEWHVIEPRREEPLHEPRIAFEVACRTPIGAPALREIIKPSDRVVIVTSDGTRPVPNRLLIPWLLEELNVALENVTVLIGTGTHRANTPAEIEAMFGAELARQLNIVNHIGLDVASHERLGTTTNGTPILVDRRYLEADKRIVLGFIEPHFFAGFSGGCKGIIPGLAATETVLHLHNYDLIADPFSTWGELERNPIQREIAGMVALCPPDFLVNVTLNSDKEITGIFAGDYRAAHAQGCAHSREVSLVPVPHRFPVVVTSNSGFPLDQNLYQAVKGMSAAARIVEPGGTIIIASECSDGLPNHGNFKRILAESRSPADVDAWIRAQASPVPDQWQAQIMAAICKHAEVLFYSSLKPEVVRSALLTPIADLQAGVEDCIRAKGAGVRVAVLPDGPLTIPMVLA